MLVLALVAATSSCRDPGGGAASVPVSPAAVWQFEDLEFEVSDGEDGGLCYRGSSPSLGFEPFDDCSKVSEQWILLPLMSTPLAPPGHDEDRWATVFGSSYELEIVGVQQDGVDVPWRQDGRAVVVVGSVALPAGRSTETVIRYSFRGLNGSCRFAPGGGESCALD